MIQRRNLIFFSLLILLFVAACGPAGNANEPSAANTTTLQGVFDNNEADEAVMDVLPTATTAVAAATAQQEETNEAETSAEVEDAAVDTRGIEIGYTTDGHAYRGKLSAPITLEEFSDFQCPYCARFADQTLPSLLENQIANGEVVMIYYDFPLTAIHPQAMVAANAARCAGEQGIAAYWQMHDRLFVNSAEWSNQNANDVFAQYGADMGLETEVFNACLTEGKYTQAIETDLAYGRSRGVNSTPSFFLNDQPLVGAQPTNVFDQAIATIQDGGNIASATQTQGDNAQAGAIPTAVPIDYETAVMTLGDENAPVRIVEYTDYQCPYCQRHFSQTLPELMEKLIDTGRVYYMLKDFPLESIHPQARLAANAARCAGEQEAYKDMHDLLFRTQGEWGTGQGDAVAQQFFADLAAQLELDADVFDQCLQERRYDDLIQADMDEALGFGVRGTPFFFVDGFPINGAQPFDLFELAVGFAEEGTLAEAYRPQQEPQQQQQQQAPPTKVEVNTEGSFAIGDPEAPITMVEFTDFQCPYCSRHFVQTLPALVQNYVDRGIVRYVFKDMPLTQIHPQAFVAAEAARCAWDQDAYMAMHDKLFNTQAEWNGRSDATAIFNTYAEELGLDVATFNECMESHQHQDDINADLQEGINLGIRGTPTFTVNGTLIFGAQPLSAFEQAISQALAESGEQ